MRTSLLLVVLMLVTVRGAVADPVRVLDGSIQGQLQNGVTVYRGIPFAAPPVGPWRWKPPQPTIPWKGVRDCLEFGPMCPQQAGPLSGVGPQSEDCLYLNVWTPSGAKGLPVMVWFHGGGNTRGSDRLSYYDGSSLARHGAVVVTAQYRLGIFGFLAHPELTAESPDHSSGNYGLLDQIAALRWVQQNIAALGGNPNQVTAFGESSGASDVSCLMTSPLAAGLFQRAILESGNVYDRYEDLQAAEVEGTETASRLSLSSLADLRQAPVETLLRIRRDSCTPNVDGWVLRQSPARAWDQHQVPLMPVIMGTNRDEGSADPDFPLTLSEYQSRLKTMFGKLYPEALTLFPCSGDDQARDAMSRVVTTLAFAAPARRQARSMASVDSHVYCYLFSKVPPGRVGQRLGAGHGTELAYVFGSFHEPVAEHVALSNRMQQAWVRFAATGDPGSADLPWPAYNADADQLIEFGDTVSLRRAWLRAECDLADRVH